MCPPGPALPYPSYTPYSPFPPRPQFPPASPIERDDLAATSRAVESIVEGQQQATQGLITHLGHIRSAAERERRQHNTEHTAVVQHLQQLILALPDLCTAQVGIEQSVRALQARTGALQDAGVPTPRTADFKQRQTETQLRDLESSVTAIRNTAEALAEVLKIKIPYLGLPGQTFPTVAQPDSWNRWNSPLANNPPFVPAYPYGQPFPSTVPPAMRTTNPYAVYSPPWAGRPMNLEPFIPGQTPRSVHWPQACESPPKPLSTVSESTEPKSPAPALPGSPWGAPYVVSSAAAVRPPPLPTATYPNVSQVPPVDSDTASPSLTNESFTYASHPPVPPPVNFDFELFDSTSMSMAPMMRRARRQEKSKVAPAPAPVPVPTTDTNKPVQFHSLSQMVRNGSPMPLYSPSPPPGPSVPYPPSFGFGYAMDMPIMAPPRFDWEIQNPLVRPPSSGPQSIELVLPQPTDVVEASAETVKRAPSAASTIESLVQVLPCPPADESICTRTMPLYSPQDNARSRSPSESLCTDSSFLAPSEPSTNVTHDEFPPPSSSKLQPQPQPAAVKKVEAFFNMLRATFQYPSTIDLAYQGFEIVLDMRRVLPDQIVDADAPVDPAARRFVLSETPRNAPVNGYVRELECLLRDVGEDSGAAYIRSRLRSELQAMQGWKDMVCKTASALSLMHEAISTKDVFAENGRA